MISIAAKLSRAARKGPVVFSLHRLTPTFLPPPPSPIRFFCTNEVFKPNTVTVQMINYALSLARSEKSDVSHREALLVLEQCQSSQSNDNSKGLVLLAMSTLYSERDNFAEAIEKLLRISDLLITCVAIRVAATEALVGLYLELGQDDTSSVLADVCLQLLDSTKLEIGNEYGILDARVKALEGLIELVRGKVESPESFFEGALDFTGSVANVGFSYGEFLHAMRNFPMAKEFYQRVIQGLSERKDFCDPCNLAACNMVPEVVSLAANCALGQVEAHLGNFAVAEDILTRALSKTEEHFGSYHPKVGVVLTCVALMFQRKAIAEHSSSLLVQEGLYRKALDLLKAPPLETEAVEANVHRRDIVALARGGYAETLLVQKNRKAEGERMKRWAETAWRNRRLSLAEALEMSDPFSEVAVIDARTSRVL